MNTNPTESIECGRDCVSCNQEGDAVKKKNMCRKSNVLYNWECNGEQCDTGYDGQSSKNNYTRSGQHRSLYESWKRREDGSINPKTGKDMFLESNLEMCGINYTSAAMYVRYGYSDIEIKAAGLERIVPVRKFTKGKEGPGYHQRRGQARRGGARHRQVGLPGPGAQ